MDAEGVSASPALVDKLVGRLESAMASMSDSAAGLGQTVRALGSITAF